MKWKPQSARCGRWLVHKRESEYKGENNGVFEEKAGILAAIAQESGPVTVLVDNATARGNVAHMAEERGRKVTVAAEGSDFRLLLE